MDRPSTPLLVLGAGAAGTFAALAARGALRGDGSSGEASESAPRVVLLDGRDPPARKIRISGGGRCNVTNERVDVGDYDTSTPPAARSVLREFPPSAVRAFFEARGVALRVEPGGKVFPAEGNAERILAALRAALAEAGVETRFGTPVATVGPTGRADAPWSVDGMLARRVVVATGGLSVPETGATSLAFDVARAAGHDLAPPVPALVPLTGDVPPSLSGLTLPAVLSVHGPGDRLVHRVAGSLLFTHRGVSGPAALDASVAAARLLEAGEPVRVLADFWGPSGDAGPFAGWRDLPKAPGACVRAAPAPRDPREVEDHLLDAARRPGGAAATVASVLSRRVPRRLVETLIPAATTALVALRRDERRAAAEALTRFDLRVAGTEGYRKAEVTAGGVRLAELHRRTMESRLAPGLHFCGEACDVTGRLGGFNFQWAWASGFVAGRGAAAGE